MDKKVLTLTAVVGAVSVGTYAVLTAVKPHQHDVAHVADVYSADAIFQGKADPNGPDETPVNAAPAAEASAAAAATPAPAEAAATAAAPAAEPVATSGDAMATPTEPGAAPAPTAETTAATPAPAPAEQTAAAPAPAPAEPAAPAPAPVEQPAAPAPAPVETAAAEPAPAPKPVKHRAPKKKAASSSTASSSVPAPASTAINAWWPAPNPAQLSMVYAGPASFKKAIVLMFNADFASADSANASIKVIDTKGNPVAPAWEVGATNKRMLILPVNGAGYYKVTVGADLADGNQRKLGSELSGDVIIK